MKWVYRSILALFSLGFLGLIGGVAIVAFAIHYYGQDLPDYKQLQKYEPSIVTRIYAGDGGLLAEYASEKRIFVPIQKVPDLVKQAFISAEDQNFYDHNGVDFYAIARAMVTNLRNAGSGRRLIGASTITQQVAKNFLLTNEVSYERKIKAGTTTIDLLTKFYAINPIKIEAIARNTWSNPAANALALDRISCHYCLKCFADILFASMDYSIATLLC